MNSNDWSSDWDARNKWHQDRWKRLDEIMEANDNRKDVVGLLTFLFVGGALAFEWPSLDAKRLVAITIAAVVIRFALNAQRDVWVGKQLAQMEIDFPEPERKS